MKKLIIFFILTLTIITNANASNIFNDKQNQFGYYIGGGLGNNIGLNGIVSIQYSQPTKFMRLDARQNIQISYIESKNEPKWGIAGTSWDVTLLNKGNFYVNAGWGFYIRSKETERLDSKFTMGERFVIGYKGENSINYEFFIQHYSNGNLTDKNAGYNFIGVSTIMNF